MHSIHFTLQGKGGVGKSLVSSLNAQYHHFKSLPVACFDTDPVNASLLGYKSLNVRRVDLVKAGTSSVDEREFDTLMEQVMAEDTNFVVDNGAASFLALSNYLVENEAIDMLAQAGRRVVVHTVVTGGQALEDTLRGLESLAQQLPQEARLIVWLNEYYGEIKARSANGEIKAFEDMAVYQKYRNRIDGVVTIYKQNPATFGKDIELMLGAQMTFEDVLASDQFGLMAKQRLKTFQRQIFDQLAVLV